MKLIPIYQHPDDLKICWDLMSEVEPRQAISHKGMPTWDDHVEFVRWKAPRRYEAWYFIDVGAGPIGWIYLTRHDEIGIRLAKSAQGKGYGPEAVALLMEMHGSRRYLANINPSNEASRKMFGALGFELVQWTYVLQT
jgi:RimJ/RimL family protein N-acetyltransferase